MNINSYAAETHQGPLLDINEDLYEADLTNNLYMILDGFGGSGIGDRCASKIRDNVINLFSKMGRDQDATLPFYFSDKYVIETNVLINAIKFSHEEIYKENKSFQMSKRGGASGIFAVLSDELISIASTGNCVGYLIRRGYIEKIVQDDSLRLYQSDHLNSHFKTSPLSGFGLFAELHLNIKELRTMEDDIYLFMTDGAYANLSEDELRHIISTQGKSLSEKIKNIFQISNDRGNKDNQTAMIITF